MCVCVCVLQARMRKMCVSVCAPGAHAEDVCVCLRVHQARMRKMIAPELLSGLEAVTGLHYNREVLHDKEEELV